VSSVADLGRSFDRHLRAENKSPRTIETYLDETYLDAVLQLAEYLRNRDIALDEATRGDIEGFLASILSRWKPATASNRYRALRIFYAWLKDEGEIEVNPMAKMKPPAVPGIADRPGAVFPRVPGSLRPTIAVCVPFSGRHTPRQRPGASCP
jgi:site-specific recombinase XerD